MADSYPPFSPEDTSPHEGSLLRPHRRHELPKRAKIAGLLSVLVAAGLIFFFSVPPNFPKGGIITIEAGQSLGSIGTDLAEGHYIRSRAAFTTLVILMGGERHVSLGDYYFPKAISAFAVSWRIAHGEHGLEQVKVTVPEGENLREVAATIAQKLPGFPIDDFLKETDGSEGYLFPETYFLYPKTSAHTVSERMRAMFDAKTEELFSAPIDGGRTKKDVVIMASILERESHGDDDRATVSGILWNRIDRGMPLQADATVAYAKGIPEYLLKKADLAIDSPYNTYQHRGLPPGPISNPGLEALSAAAHPAKTLYLYYLHDRRGTIHYAKTYAEHQANVQKYLK